MNGLNASRETRRDFNAGSWHFHMTHFAYKKSCETSSDRIICYEFNHTAPAVAR